MKNQDWVLKEHSENFTHEAQFTYREGYNFHVYENIYLELTKESLMIGVISDWSKGLYFNNKTE